MHSTPLAHDSKGGGLDSGFFLVDRWTYFRFEQILSHFFFTLISESTINNCLTMSNSLQLISNYNSDSENDETEQMDQQGNSGENILNENEEIINEQVTTLVKSIINHVVLRVDGESFSTYRTTCDEHELQLNESSDDDSSSLSSWSLDSDDESDDQVITGDRNNDPSKPKQFRSVKTKGELDLNDLPPIQHLDINMSTDLLVHLGRVVTIVDRLVSIVSFKNTPALDLDTVLFMKTGRPLGTVFDVFGPVSQPIYVVRFNTQEEITDYGVTLDMPVYFVPTVGDPVTKFVFVKQLMQEKGSDASWEHNNEPPEECKDFSDDEEERNAKSISGKKRPHLCAK